MKKLLLILLVLGIAGAVAYLLGTDAGRARRDDLLARTRRASSVDDDLEIDLTAPSGSVDEVVPSAAPTG
jgi:hypothetical protein